MSGKSDYLEGQFLAHIFRTAAFTKPTVIAVALCTAAPSDASTGATIAEAAYTGYSRTALNPLDTNWAAPSAGNGQTSNSVAITIGSAPTSGPTVATHFAILDSTTVGAGNVLYWAALTASKTINSGDPAPYFPIGSLVVTEA